VHKFKGHQVKTIVLRYDMKISHLFSTISYIKVKLSLYLIKHYAMKTYGRVKVQLHDFLTSALDGGELSASRPGCFTLRGKSPRYPLDRRLGGPPSRSGSCGEKISRPFRE
jgi:hypothetical protein